MRRGRQDLYYFTACILSLDCIAFMTQASTGISQCDNYTHFSDRFRNINYRPPPRIPKCDNKLAPLAWYRFSGDAGTRMPSFQVNSGSCSSVNPGWVRGDHPRGLNASTTAEVCFDVHRNQSCGASVEIRITDCGRYFVYRLPRIVNCSKVYCGENGGEHVTLSPSLAQTSTKQVSGDETKGVDTCPEEKKAGIVWPSTKVGHSSTQPCPSGKGIVKRICSNSGWKDVNITSCTLPEINALYKEVEYLGDPNMTHEAKSKAAKDVINKLTNITDLDHSDRHQDQKGLDENELVYSVKIIQLIIQLNISNASLNILQPASNILDLRNKKTFGIVKNSSEVISNLVVSLENYGFQLGRDLRRNDNESTIIQKKTNLELRVKIVKPKTNSTAQYTNFPLTNASFELSPSAFHPGNNETAVVVVVHYSTLHSLLAQVNLRRGQTNFDDMGSDTEYILNNEIITASVRPKPPIEFEKPVRIIWRRKRSHSTKCVFWQPENMESTWGTEGCRALLQQSENIVCECNHLTAFASIGITDLTVSRVHRKSLEIISTVGCSLSLLGIILTMVSYMKFWGKLHSKSQTEVRPRVLMHLCVAVGMTDILAIVAGPALNNQMFCTVVSISLYFFVLSVFGWMLCEGIVIYFLLVRIFSGLGGRHLRVFYAIGWGIPTIVVSLSVGLIDRRRFITEHACWFRADGPLLWIFVGLTGVTLLVNIAVLIIVLIKMFSSHRLSSADVLDKAKAAMKATAVLLPLLGLTWSFGLMAFNRDVIIFKYLFAIFNSLQGLMIFFFHVLFNKQIHDVLQREKTMWMTRARMPNNVLSNNQKCGTFSTSNNNFEMNLEEYGSLPHQPKLSLQHSKINIRSSAMLVVTNENINNYQSNTDKCLTVQEKILIS